MSRRVREGSLTSTQDLSEAIIEGAVQRVRPKMLTVAAIIAGPDHVVARHWD
jgi:copper/silver efflux system protein